MKQVAYALILLHKDGVPCLFYGDLYGIPCTRNIPIPRLRTMVRVRHDYAYGEQHDYMDHYNVVGWTREGDAEHPNSGLALLLSDKRPGKKRMYVGKHFAGRCFKDCLRKVREDATEADAVTEDAEEVTEADAVTEDAEEVAEADDSLEGMTEEGKAIVARLQAEETPEGPATENVYAILYEDGTLVFQVGDTPKSEGAVTATYPVDMVNGYSSDAVAPWYGSELITKVDFADAIQPLSISSWFMDCRSLTQITNLSNLDVSQVTTMRNAFSGCSSLEALTLIVNSKGIWDTSKVTDMRGVFAGCNALTELNLSAWNTSAVTNMEEAFAGCEGLTELGLARLNTSNVTDMSGAFMGCLKLTELDLTDWDTSKVTDMSKMFDGCNSLNVIRASNGFVTSQVTNSADMFAGCDALTGGNGTAFNGNRVDAAYARVDASGAPGYFAPGVFVILYDDGLMVFQYGETPESGRTVAATYPVDIMNSYNMVGRQIPDMPWYETRESITRVDFADKFQPRVVSLWFYQCANLTEVLHGENLDLSKCNSIQNLFYGCGKLETVDVSTWDTVTENLQKVINSSVSFLLQRVCFRRTATHKFMYSPQA